MLTDLDRLLAALPRPVLIAFALVALALVGVLDYLTGYEISFAVFYLVPVGLAAWYASRRSGFGFALASSIVWYLVERLGAPYVHPAIPAWNAIVRLGFFLIVAGLLSTLRERLATERQFAKTDALTGVLNARTFTEQLDRDLALARRGRSAVTLAYVDLDDFKQINDTYGHSQGDRLLSAIGRALIAGARRTDTVARLGGDEFGMILPGTDFDGAQVLIAKLRQTLGESTVSGIRPVTCSVGAVVFREAPRDPHEAIAAADRLMYSVKHHGKNQVAFGIYDRTGIEVVPPESTDPPTIAGR